MKEKSSAPADANEAEVVRAAERELRRVGWRAIPAREKKRAAEAREYEYYWYKARKRIDIRTLDGFGPLAQRAIEEHRTGMKYDRLYTLWQAVAGLRCDGHAILEVGAFRGGSAHFIGSALRWHGRSNPFFVCDTFEGHAVAEEGLDGDHRVGEQFVGTSFEEVAAYLSEFDNIRVVRGDFRETARTLESLPPLSFAHVDVDVYAVTRFALDFVAPRLVPGGVIVVDDYGFLTCPGVKKAVDEFRSSSASFAFLHLLTGQAVLTRCG